MKVARAAAIGLLLALCHTAVAANLLANGDFESGDVGFGTDYRRVVGDPHEPAEYALVANPRSVRGDIASFSDHTSGNGAGLMLMGNGGLGTNDVVWFARVGVDPGSTYSFSLWVASWYATLPSEFSLRINSVEVGSTFFGPSVTGTWQDRSFDWNSGSATSALIALINLSTVYTGNDFALDDLSFTKIASPLTATEDFSTGTSPSIERFSSVVMPDDPSFVQVANATMSMPEPGACALIALALVLLGFASPRRSKQLRMPTAAPLARPVDAPLARRRAE